MQVANYIDSTPWNQDVLEALISSGGKTNLMNLARILQLAASQLAEEADPSLIDDDRVANYKDKARTCSDEEMSRLWAQLLSEEANNPGSYSRKTVNVLADLEPADARLFRSLSNFRLVPVNPAFDGEGALVFTRAFASPKLAVLDDKHQMYTDTGINFDSLARLQWLGLVRYVSFGYEINQGSSRFAAYEHGEEHIFLASNKPIPFGSAEFTPSGTQLSELCIPIESPDGFLDYLARTWEGKGVRVARSIVEATEMATQTQ